MKTKWTWIFIFITLLFIGCFGDTETNTETKYVTTEVEVQVTDTYESTPSSAYEEGKLTIIYKPSEDKNILQYWCSPTKTFLATWPIFTEVKKDRVYIYEMERVLTTDVNMWYNELSALYELRIFIGEYDATKYPSSYQTHIDYTFETFGLASDTHWYGADNVFISMCDIAENEEVYIVIDENLKKYFITRRLN